MVTCHDAKRVIDKWTDFSLEYSRQTHFLFFMSWYTNWNWGYMIFEFYGLLPSNQQFKSHPYIASRLCELCIVLVTSSKLSPTWLLEPVSIVASICWSNMSSYVRSRTFCCCLPVRFGVFVSHHRFAVVDINVKRFPLASVFIGLRRRWLPCSIRLD